MKEKRFRFKRLFFFKKKTHIKITQKSTIDIQDLCSKTYITALRAQSKLNAVFFNAVRNTALGLSLNSLDLFCGFHQNFIEIERIGDAPNHISDQVMS